MKQITLALVLLLLPVLPALAGGSAETTLVVVNGDSPLSRAVANEYVARRGIPESHVVHLTGIPHTGVVELEFFRTNIWAPIEAAMADRGIADAVDLIEYSADFPYGVNFRGVLDNPNPGHQIGGTAALTGVTYLARAVAAGAEFWNLEINQYFRIAGGGPRGLTAEEQAHGIRATKALEAKDYAAAARAFEALFRTFRESANAWYNYACCLARLGRKGEALDALATAGEMGFTGADHARNDPDLESIRGDPRFERIVSSLVGAVLPFLPAHGFRAGYGWKLGAGPDVKGADGGRYFLSTMLAYSGHTGNSLPEIRGYLGAAADSDGTRPGGTVYICRNGDVRSTSREPFFGSLIAGLNRLGRKVEILEKGEDGQDGVLPIGKDDVIGAVVGRAGFDWGKSGSRLLPGAIAEHLTSFGAHFGTPGQTKLTEFLRYGAAGSSGTVIEPLSIHQKFPNPMIHVFYAEGCSLGEAFYQSTWGPYQLLVVGDGLARPFADFVTVDPGAPPTPWAGTVEFAPKAKGAESFELFVDGRLAAAGQILKLDTTRLGDGWHDVRVVAIGPAPVETRSVATVDGVVANGDAGEDVTRRGAPEVAFEDVIEFRAKGAKRLEIHSQGRVVAAADGDKVEIPAALVGPGPVALVPVTTVAGGGTWISKPVTVTVAEPRPAKAERTGKPSRDGLLLRLTAGGKDLGRAIGNLGDRRGGAVLREVVTEANSERLVFTGWMEVPETGFYRLHLHGGGTVTVELSGLELAENAELSPALWLPAGLERGWHAVRIELVPKGRPDLEILLGGETVTGVPKFGYAGPPAYPTAPDEAEPGEDGGFELRWNRTVKDLGGVRIFPPDGAKTFPLDWIVEYRTGSGSWREVRTSLALVSPGKEVPNFIEILFRELRAKQLRVRPKDGGEAVPKKVEVLLRQP